MKNVAASVRTRLSNLARETRTPLAVLTERFALGRLLWRLSRGGSGDRFVLKGAQLFALWAEDSHRTYAGCGFSGIGRGVAGEFEGVFRDASRWPGRTGGWIRLGGKWRRLRSVRISVIKG